MPDIKMLNIININCNTTDKEQQEADRANNCSTNTAIGECSRHEKHYTNMIQDIARAKKCDANTDIISKFDNKDKPTVINKESI